MYPLITPQIAETAAEHLSKSDPFLSPVIPRLGYCTIVPHQDYYRSLVDSIIGQQLSVKAADSIKRRFRDLFGKDFPEPSAILARSLDDLRTAGLSLPKARYIQDLAAHVESGTVRFDRIAQQSNEDIIRELTAVKGIGEWTAHMFLMFCVGRTNILPVGDLGIQNSIQRLYGLEARPLPAEMRAIAAQYQWEPYESIASWYLWESLDTLPQ